MVTSQLQTPDKWIVKGLPAFTDNYIWIMINHNFRKMIVIDPGDANPVLAFCQQHTLCIAAILVTHHHADHTAGIAVLKQHFPKAKIYGPAHEKIIGVDVVLQNQDSLKIADLQEPIEVLHVPGHTLGHIAFWLPKTQWLFCGDTLFAAGCGKLFEGTAEQMYNSLQQIAKLPAQTLIFCTHEYTQSNLKFAHHVEPNNADITNRLTQVTRMRQQDICTLPSNLALELKTNPFLRVSNCAEFAKLRQQKDVFK
jgi:hydroxyacylglutathione hydrolase